MGYIYFSPIFKILLNRLKEFLIYETVTFSTLRLKWTKEVPINEQISVFTLLPVLSLFSLFDEDI